MMMVDTELKLSGIHGIGVFLLEPVVQGQLIWRFDSRIDRVYSEDELASLPDRTRSFLHPYSTWRADLGLWVLCGDNGRHFNHSATPNTVSDAIAYCEYPDGKLKVPRTSSRPASAVFSSR